MGVCKTIVTKKYDINNRLISSVLMQVIHEEHFQHDEKGNQTEYKNLISGFESKSIFDDRNNKIKSVNSEGTTDFVYNNIGKLIFCKDSSGNEKHFEYDNKGNQIYHKEEDVEEWTEYDERGNKISRKTSFGFKASYTYDSNDNLIYYEDSEGDTKSWTYDKNNNVIHYKEQGEEEFFTYDENGKLISYRNKIQDELKATETIEYYPNEIHKIYSDLQRKKEKTTIIKLDKSGNEIEVIEITKNL